MTFFSDTICAPATSTGTGAISIIRVSGPDSLAIADKVIHFRKGDAASSAGYTLKFGSILTPSGETLDDVLVSIFRAPHSYTGEDGLEISCHASQYIVNQILAMLIDAGCRSAGPGEFTRRAFVNGKMDLAQAEAVADVISSSSEAMHRVAMNQLKGGYSAELGEMRAQMLELAALMELELDFSEEEVNFADRSRLAGLLDAAITRVSSLSDTFRTGNALKNGVPTVIAGAANSGKSTLLNALLGEDRAIVSDIPGTTRDTIEETMNVGGIIFRFIDTAGLRETSDTIEKMGIERSLASIGSASVVIGVVDGSLPVERQAEDADMIRQAAEGKDLIMVCNKSDAAVQVDRSLNDAIRISALKKEGIDTIRERLLELERSRFSEHGANMVTNLRHYEALRRSLSALQNVRTGLDAMIPTDLLAEDLRMAIAEIGSVTGEISTDEVLGEIFKRFCIGK